MDVTQVYVTIWNSSGLAGSRWGPVPANTGTEEDGVDGY